MAKASRAKISKSEPSKARLSKNTLGYVLAAVLIIAALFLAAPAISSFLTPAGTSSSSSGTATVYYFYGEECPSCKTTTPYIENLSARYPDVDFQVLDVYHNKTNYDLFVSLNTKAGETQLTVPRVFYRDTVLIGPSNIISKLEQAIIEKKKVTLNIPTSAVLSSGPEVTKASVIVNAVYFYGDTCSHCAKVKPVLADLESRYPELNLTRLEVYNNAENRQVLSERSRAHGIQNPGVPLIIIGDTVLSGDAVITSDFEQAILAEKERLVSCNGTPAPQPSTDNPECAPASTTLSLPLVVVAALVDSANPCGLSVLVFLLITMAAAGERKRVLFAGGAYIAAMFLFHLLMGIGLLSVFALSGFAKLFSMIGGAVALLLGLITIADLLWNRETFILSIPESKKGLLGDFARRASLPAAFVLGILAGILGFTCTGGIYISILGLMGRDMSVMAGLPWLILYNLVYVLPLVLVTLLVAYGLSPERADALRTQYKRPLRLAIGLALIALGAVILLGWIG